MRVASCELRVPRSECTRDSRLATILPSSKFQVVRLATRDSRLFCPALLENPLFLIENNPRIIPGVHASNQGNGMNTPGEGTSQSEAIMKRELCKRDSGLSRVLCDTCADAIRRLVKITQGSLDGEPKRHKTADAAAA